MVPSGIIWFLGILCATFGMISMASFVILIAELGAAHDPATWKIRFQATWGFFLCGALATGLGITGAVLKQLTCSC